MPQEHAVYLFVLWRALITTLLEFPIKKCSSWASRLNIDWALSTRSPPSRDSWPYLCAREKSNNGTRALQSATKAPTTSTTNTGCSMEMYPILHRIQGGPCGCGIDYVDITLWVTPQYGFHIHPIPDTWNAFFRGKFHITEKSLVN